ncbi:hypothetical protein KJ966_06855 [bacterium]|nr:hypothetical protein [bacterium]
MEKLTKNTDCCQSKSEKKTEKLECECSQQNGTDVSPSNKCCGAALDNQLHSETALDVKKILGKHHTAVGEVTKVDTVLSYQDVWGSILTRLGINRDCYAIDPGLYCVGSPDDKSPVLVTANYKLSFDALRKELSDVDAWILVLDTKGVNVWCAAGKGTFATNELLHQIKAVELAKIVSHRKLILPQLSATGVSGHLVKEESGFKVCWGPIRASDIKPYLASHGKTGPDMRRIRFTFIDRMVLIPVEIKNLLKPAGLLLVFLGLLSGIGPDLFSIDALFARGTNVLMAGLIGILSGTVLTPLVLPWIPFRAFFLKGIGIGSITGVLSVNTVFVHLSLYETVALLLFSVMLSSFLAMNFTGSTPYTSPSGVEKEMRIGIPVQVFGVLTALALWMISPFL